jgi:hypothetical protein
MWTALELLLDLWESIFLRPSRKHPVVAVMLGVVGVCLILALSGIGSGPWFYVAIFGLGALCCLGLWLLRER